MRGDKANGKQVAKTVTIMNDVGGYANQQLRVFQADLTASGESRQMKFFRYHARGY